MDLDVDYNKPCKYSHDSNFGINNKTIICNKDNRLCPKQKFCTQCNRYKMNKNYTITCKNYKLQESEEQECN